MSGTALVTGASAGIGREFCAQLAARGHDLVVVSRDEARLRGLAAELGGRYGVSVEVLAADLTSDHDVDRVVARIATLPALALLVNNAGFGVNGTIAGTPPGPQEAMVRLQVLAPFRLTRAALPGLIARRAGAIVNVSSVASFLFSPGKVNYCATKAYLTSFSEGLALELRGTGVQVQALCPGFTRSEFHARMGGDQRRPRFMWMDAEPVVRASLAQLDRRGPVICVPGGLTRTIAAAVGAMPRPLLRALLGRARPV